MVYAIIVIILCCTRNMLPFAPNYIISQFKDEQLMNVILDAVNKSESTITFSDMENLTYLSARSKNITYLDGIELCTNLHGLDLSANYIEDISPLAELRDLYDLNLSHNNITNITALKDLSNLTNLHCVRNRVNDI